MSRIWGHHPAHHHPWAGTSHLLASWYHRATHPATHTSPATPSLNDPLAGVGPSSPPWTIMEPPVPLSRAITPPEAPQSLSERSGAPVGTLATSWERRPPQEGRPGYLEPLPWAGGRATFHLPPPLDLLAGNKGGGPQ